MEEKYYRVPQIPKNDKVPTSSYVDPSTLASTSESKASALKNILELKEIIKDNGYEDYNLKDSFVVGELPLSPRSYGKPYHIDKVTKIIRIAPTTFTKWGDLNKEIIDEENTSNWLYQDKKEEPPLPMDEKNKGLQLMKGMG